MYPQIPQGLQALMVLQRQASQMGPAGPTVANQLMQRVQQPPQPPQPPGPPQGPQGPQQGQMPGPPGMMAGTPNQGPQGMMDTLKAQSQQSAQPPQQPPGPPPQGMAHGGIASLRADNIARMKYAQGGVIGFANQGYVDPLGMGTAAPGEETSDTPGKKDKELLRALISMGMLPAAALDLLQAPAAAVARTSLPGVDPNKFSYTPAVSALRNALANIDKPEEPAPAPAPEQVARPAVEDARRREDIPPGGMVVATPGGAAAPAPRPPASPRPAAPAATGIAQLAAENPDLVVARRLRDAQFTGTAPTIESTLAEQQKFRAAQGLTGPVGSAIEAAIKANAERAAATEAAYRKGQEGQGTEEWISMLTKGKEGVGALGAEFVRGRQAQRAAEMNFQQLMNASAEKREQMGITLQNLREAEANRDYTAYQKNLDEFRKQKHDFDTVQRQLAASTLQGSVQMQEGAANRASQEKIARIREASQLGQLDMRRQAMAAQAAKAVEMDPLLKQLATLAMAGDPAATKRYQDREAEIYMRIAPELMLGGGAPSGGSALASATAIARGKQ